MSAIKRVTITALNHTGAEGLRSYWKYRQKLVPGLKKVAEQMRTENFTDGEFPVIQWKFKVSMAAQYREDTLAGIRQTFKGFGSEGSDIEIKIK